VRLGVTGVGVFIGGALVRQLGAHPIARTDVVAEAFDAVFHCAHQRDGDQWAVNRECMIRRWNECRAAGVGQFVYLSSLAAHAGAQSEYGRVKWRLEQELAAAAAGEEMRLAIVRPGLVLGEGGIAGELRALARGHRLLPLVYGRRRMQTITLDDLVRVLATVAERRLEGVLVAADTSVPVREVYRHLAPDARWIPVPGELALAAARGARWLGMPFPVSADRLLGLRGLCYADPAASNAVLGFAPRGLIRRTEPAFQEPRNGA
jgi:nucleoside-diphosphate-sugar epimerase